MKRPVPLKGSPDFSFLSDEKVREYRELINAMLASYGDFPDKKKLLEEMWSDLNAECANRISELPEEVITKKTLAKFNRRFLKKSKLGT